MDLTLFWMVALLAPLLAACATGPTPPPPPKPEDRPFTACARPDDGGVPFLDEAERRLHETVCGAALWFDNLFGEGDLRAARGARGHLEVTTSYSEFEGEATRVRFSARVPFPALEERLSGFVGVDDNEDVARDRTEGVGLRSATSRLDEADDFFAGLGYVLEEAYGVRTDFRVGVRSLREPRAFAQLRANYTAYADDVNRVDLRLTPFYNTRDGFGATASTDIDHSLAPTRLLRWGTVGTISQNTEGLDWRSAVVLYQSLGYLRALGFEVFERGATAAPEPLTEYGVRTIYREPLFAARLFANIVVGYSWPRVDPALPREGSWSVSLGFELPYGPRN